MEEDRDFREEPLDFSGSSAHRKCPYCGETLSAEELENYASWEGNTFICPNCRKRLNIDELGTAI
ncbi:MAG: hypothetical protein JW869_08195 [Candidatus Omnitrophica bacterium]|nr:hypothetical protein [Candidatus Omnitrophota bacterium]